MLRQLIRPYIEAGYVRAERHPTLPLTIYNYTQKCTIDRAWDFVTRVCRGLVLDDNGRVVARPIPKFFNHDEPEAGSVPWGEETFDLEEKLDGSLIIAFEYEGQFIFATRGSFVSEQAAKAAELLKKNDLRCLLLPGITYIFEVVYPEDQKVVEYKKETLYLITRIETATGVENRAGSVVFPMPKRLEGLYIRSADKVACQFADLTGVEGFVARFENGARVKFKTPWYVERHRYLQQLSPRFIWSQMKEGKFAELNKFVPKIHRERVTGIARDIANLWTVNLYTGLEAAQNARGMTNVRKGQAKYIMKHYPEVSRIAFNFLDGKTEEAFESAWRKVKP